MLSPIIAQESSIETIETIVDKVQRSHDRIATLLGEGPYSVRDALCRWVLAWVGLARRPLSRYELTDALAVAKTMKKYRKSRYWDHLDPRTLDYDDICYGYVGVGSGDGILSLTDPGPVTEQCLNQMLAMYFPDAQKMIAENCVKYLSSFSRPLKNGFQGTGKEFKKWLESNSFYDYATRNWEHHVRASLLLPQGVLDFLIRHLECKAKTELFCSDQRKVSLEQVTPLHLVSYYGFESAVRTLWDQVRLNAKDAAGRTPLIYASARGHREVVSLLLHDGASLESRDKDGLTPLSWAVANGHEGVVELLLSQSPKPVLSDHDHSSLLERAVKDGHRTIARMLIDHDPKFEHMGDTDRVKYLDRLYNPRNPQKPLYILLYASFVYLADFLIGFVGICWNNNSRMWLYTVAIGIGLVASLTYTLGWTLSASMVRIHRGLSGILHARRRSGTPVVTILPGSSRVLFKCVGDCVFPSH